MPLSDFQVRLAGLLRTVPGADGFVLAGGSALAVLGIGDRRTNDLDWFAERADAVEAFAPRFVQVCIGAGLAISEVVAQAGFHRFEISDGHTATIVDLAWDARLRPPQATPFGPVLDRDELAADKTLALFGRAAPRDFVDVYRLRAFYEREQLSALALEKDRGFDPVVFAEMIAKLDRYERQDFPVDDDTYRDLRHEFDSWVAELRPEPKPNPSSPGSGPRPRPERPGLDLD